MHYLEAVKTWPKLANLTKQFEQAARLVGCVEKYRRLKDLTATVKTLVGAENSKGVMAHWSKLYRQARKSKTLLHGLYDHQKLPTICDTSVKLGLSESALHKWLTRHGLLHLCPKDGNRRHIPDEILERYLRETRRPGAARAAHKPKGYVGIKQAAADSNNTYDRIWKGTLRGTVRAVRVGHINYYCLDDCIRLNEEWRSSLLVAGATKISHLADQHGADRHSVRRWLFKNGFTVTTYRDPEDGQKAAYTDDAGVAAWTASHTDPSKKGVRYCPECKSTYVWAKGHKHGRFCSNRCQWAEGRRRKALGDLEPAPLRHNFGPVSTVIDPRRVRSGK